MSVYLDKIGDLPPVTENEAMHFGKKLEQLVADEYKERTGHRIERRNFMYQHPEKPWALANVDRVIYDRERGPGVLEVKTASEYSKSDWASGIVPEQYQLQLQWYLWIMGYEWGAFAVLVGGNKFYSYEMERNETIISYMVDIAERFWYGVQHRIPPAFDGSTDSDRVLKALYPSSVDNEIDLTASAADLLEQYEKAKAEKTYWESVMNNAENQIKGLMQDAERARVGDRLVTWKSQTRESVDVKWLAEELPDVYKQYLKQSSSRVFRVKGA